MSRTVLALLLAAAAAPAVPGAALAQTAGPTPGEIVSQQLANQNRFQLQLQANQLQQLQRQNSVALQQPDPILQARAIARRRQIEQQIDQNTALQQQMARPDANPTDVRARLQQDSALIQQMQQQQPIPSPTDVR